MKLGTESEVLAAMEEFIAEAGAGSPPEVDPPSTAPLGRTAPSPPAPVEVVPPRKQTENERTEQRHDVSIIGRVRASTGTHDVTVHDLSERGCRFHNPVGQLVEGMPLTIKLRPIGPIAATVKWCRAGYAGLEFRDPLYPSVLEYIREHFDSRR